MGDSVTPEVEVLSDMIRQYFSQERSEKETIQALNHLRRVLHEVSPFAQEPVDCVLWVKADEVVANDYNPNVMAPGEKKLLKQTGRELSTLSIDPVGLAMNYGETEKPQKGGYYYYGDESDDNGRKRQIQHKKSEKTKKD